MCTIHHPRLSWRANVVVQGHYQVQAASAPSLLRSGNVDLWDTGKVRGERSRNIPYKGKPLNSEARVFWRVRVWPRGQADPGKWSDVGRWEMGLLNQADWRSKWLQAPTFADSQESDAVNRWVQLVSTVEYEDGSLDTPALDQLNQKLGATLFRHQFAVNQEPVRARLHSTAGGYYEIFLNGTKVGDRIMDPGQTDFDKRILYNTDDVSGDVGRGQNVIAVHLGSGWYNESIAFSAPGKNLQYGVPTFTAQLVIYFDDGSSQVVTSDEAWQAHPSPVVKEGLFSGEIYDGSKNQHDWHNVSASHQSKNWKSASVRKELPTQKLEPQLLPPIRTVKAVQPLRILNPSENVWVFDFGQNFTGVPTLHLDKLRLAEGQAVFLRYAEWADSQGNISQLSGGGWATHLNAVDAYVAGSHKEVHWTPSFSWHGFRYIEVSGLKEQPPLAALSAQLVRSDVARAGDFSSSDDQVNRIHRTALWSYESNLMSVPLDCPNREKAGWTGDAHAALITGNYNFNMENFWLKYLGDFRTARHVAPTVVPGKRTDGGKIDWAAAEVFISWEHWRHHGDRQALETQYPSLMEYMEFGQNQMSAYLLEQGYGDWCDPVRAPGTPRVGGRGTPQWTSTAVTSTALFARSVDLMSKIAAALNKSEDSKRFAALYQNLSQGFHEAFYDAASGHYGSQTADAMALRFGLAPAELRQSVADALSKDVRENWGGHSSVGALGQTWLYLALSDFGHTDTAFNIFKAQGYPGFSYLFDELDGTTLWERKGAFDPGKGRGPVRSLNHPFHGGYDGWFYQGLGGIRPLENTVGFQEFMLKPVFPSQLDTVDASYESGYGKISSRWERKAGQIHWQFSIPANSSAWVHFLTGEKQRFFAGSYEFVFDE